MDLFVEILKTLIIGIVEGITEWLPISSTGHMILVDEFIELQVSDDFLELFLVLIQIGAILAVIILYFHKLNPFSAAKTEEERQSTWRLWGMVVVGCIPAAIFGFALDDWVNEHFYNKVVVACALIAYGIVFIVLEGRNRRRLDAAARLVGESQTQGGQPVHQEPLDNDQRLARAEDVLFKVQTVDEIDWKTALKIGCFQVLAIIPGTSRSGSTIIGGMLCGCSRTAAAEFTFFLAIPVMFGWGLVKALKFFFEGLVMTQVEIVVLLVGMLSAFVVSVLAIRFLMCYIQKNDFTAFGIYRIIIGVLVLIYFAFELAGVLP